MTQKIKFFAAIVIVVFVATFAIAIIGCDEGMNMMKPVLEDQKPENPTPTEDPMPPPEEPAPPEKPMPPDPMPPKEPTAREKAISVALETIEMIQSSELRPQWEFFASHAKNEKTEQILLEKIGLDWMQFQGLAFTCLSETDNIQHVRGNNIRSFVAFTDVLVNYLELTYTHPEKTRDEIIYTFAMRCANGKVTALGRTVMRIYHPELLEEYDAAWDLFFSLRNPDDEDEGGDVASAE